MSYTVINHKDVKYDVLQAKDWYKRQQEGLENDLLMKLKSHLTTLLKILYCFK